MNDDVQLNAQTVIPKGTAMVCPLCGEETIVRVPIYEIWCGCNSSRLARSRRPMKRKVGG